MSATNNKNLGIKELAKLSGVSIGTVDRVLHNRSGVSPRTKEKVLRIIEEMGYKKNVMASRLKLASTKALRVALLLPRTDNDGSYWNLPKQGIDAAVHELSELGFSTEYYFFDLSNPQTFSDNINPILEGDFDALITVPFFEDESNRLLLEAEIKKMPVVFLDTERSLSVNSNFIRQNAYNAGMVAGRLLHGLVGNDGVYFVINIVNERGKQINNSQREEGFRAFFNSSLKEKEVEIHVINHSVDGELNLTQEQWEAFETGKLKGIFVTNARSFLLPNLLRQHRVKNTKIVGFDLNEKNVTYLKSGAIDFLINQKPQYQGYSAIKGLYKYLTEENDSQLNIDIPIEIVVKENVDFYQELLHGM